MITAPGLLAAMLLTSPSFPQDGAIPPRFTCDGSNVSPALSWRDVPEGTRSLALIVTDPDAPDPAAPKTTWTHWIVYNVPPETRGLREAIPAKGLPADTLEGKNDWGKAGYGGPCPPIGRHRYVHTLYALDARLPDLAGPARAALLQAMEGHVLAQAVLVGTYKRE